MTTSEVEKITIENAISIKGLATVSDQILKDVDRIVKHLDKPLSPLKILLIGTVITGVLSFNTYMLLEIQKLRLDVDTHKTEHIADIQKLEDAVKKNTEQDKYIIGRLNPNRVIEQ